MWICLMCGQRNGDDFPCCGNCGTGKDGAPVIEGFETVKQAAAAKIKPRFPFLYYSIFFSYVMGAMIILGSFSAFPYVMYAMRKGNDGRLIFPFFFSLAVAVSYFIIAEVIKVLLAIEENTRISTGQMKQ